MDGATTASTGSNNSTPGGTNNNGGANGFLNLGNLGSSSTATVGGMGLFSTGGGGDALGGFGASLGNGFANDGASIGAGGGAGGSANPSFDISDFPSLGGGAAGGVGAAGNPAGNADLAAALRQQQQQLQQQLMQRGVSEADKSSNLYRLAMSSGIAQGAGNNFSMATEDFPALGGGAGGEGKEGGLGSAPTGGSILDPSGGNQLDYTGLIGSTGGATSSSVQQTRTTTTAGSGASSTAGGSTNAGSGGAIGGDYGLLGLLSVIRMTDADRNRLALGSDLTVLGGLNLNSPESIHSTFGGPFSIKPSTKEPHYQVRKLNTPFFFIEMTIYSQQIMIHHKYSCQCVTTCNRRH